MKKFLLAVKKYLLGCLRHIAPYVPIAIVLRCTLNLILDSPYKSQQQFIWFIVYSLFVYSSPIWVEITENVINKALQDDKT